MASNDRPYRSVVFVVAAHASTAGSIARYFIDRSESFSLIKSYHFEPPENSSILELRSFLSGREIFHKRWKVPGFLPWPVKYGLRYLLYAWIAMAYVPRRSWFITHDPSFLIRLKSVWNKVLGHREVFWVWDHFEDNGRSYQKRIDSEIRLIKHVLFVSEPLLDLYERRVPAGSVKAMRAILPIGVGDALTGGVPTDGLLGYVGNVSDRRGLGIALEALRLDPSLRLEIIGDGALMANLRAYAEKYGIADRVTFHGRIEDDELLKDVVLRWQIGLAPYESSPYVAYADPGKIKDYLRFGLPVITTNLTPLRDAIRTEHAGEVVAPSSVTELTSAIARIRSDRTSYLPGVERLRRHQHYTELYDQGFAFMRE